MSTLSLGSWTPYLGTIQPHICTFGKYFGSLANVTSNAVHPTDVLCSIMMIIVADGLCNLRQNISRDNKEDRHSSTSMYHAPI
eukprot:scaffold6302_cov157-Skeletonema_menzelii.AAC.7